MTRISLAWLALLVVACGEPDNGLDLDGVCEDQPCSGHGTCVESGAVPACGLAVAVGLAGFLGASGCAFAGLGLALVAGLAAGFFAVMRVDPSVGSYGRQAKPQ